ncbi:type IX secretion system membrane protein PorP/SprF [Aggregatimonas sangjinii]|uniref:Type IX secretion system membrane protein PorP/SprF n=1 Tax=Aggregatimonas sangjinii TaxID=2583587 RepID=A0A5B7SJV2_9FLAO|nr:type IX secretion system membrane protein PorP/SprF [Aggregatimonas sangjinii]QCW98706.1 type IX secretion system membrane protein PorP/SprF [Aggregatimonas sangjinii]
MIANHNKLDLGKYVLSILKDCSHRKVVLTVLVLLSVATLFSQRIVFPGQGLLVPHLNDPSYIGVENRVKVTGILQVSDSERRQHTQFIYAQIPVSEKLSFGADYFKDALELYSYSTAMVSANSKFEFGGENSYLRLGVSAGIDSRRQTGFPVTEIPNMEPFVPRLNEGDTSFTYRFGIHYTYNALSVGGTYNKLPIQSTLARENQEDLIGYWIKDGFTAQIRYSLYVSDNIRLTPIVSYLSYANDPIYEGAVLVDVGDRFSASISYKNDYSINPAVRYEFLETFQVGYSYEKSFGDVTFEDVHSLSLSYKFKGDGPDESDWKKAAVANNRKIAAIKRKKPKKEKNEVPETDVDKQVTDEAVQKEAAEQEEPKKAAAEREAQEKETAEKEAAAREVTQKEALAKETAEKEAAQKEAAERQAAQEAAEREAAEKEAAQKEATKRKAAREAAAQEAAQKEALAKEAAEKEAAQKEAAERQAAQEAAEREAAEQEAAKKEAEQRAAERRAAELQEAAQKEATERKAAQEAAERQEAERKAVELQEAAQKEAVEQKAAQEAAEKEAEQREAERKAVELQEAAAQKAAQEAAAEKVATEREVQEKIVQEGEPVTENEAEKIEAVDLAPLPPRFAKDGSVMKAGYYVIVGTFNTMAQAEAEKARLSNLEYYTAIGLKEGDDTFYLYVDYDDVNDDAKKRLRAHNLDPNFRKAYLLEVD